MLDTLLILVERLPGESEKWILSLDMVSPVQDSIARITQGGGEYLPNYTRTASYQTREDAEKMLRALGFEVAPPSPRPLRVRTLGGSEFL